ncbi:MAG: hypothetical protein GFH27_549311n131 [Chloroflexi bacterium AL-W]|nr:hypothetical protein [Chloroflexi bacterium AL-N1]NOK68691.1 hypothetical protein [Chloroflexi bacterium AL-N10]NOK76177.1 hypothetical protein [Chloroflexi bacterium AL-N5]NOK84186.1 hypothetical protein [Chloroflexi bacterium AL-W]NOK91315.1 hypothetical protein [Chloroflexi bacterium AL-N15]
MIGNYIEKIYEVRSEFDERYDMSRIAFSINIGLFTLFLLNNVLSNAAPIEIIGSVLLILGNVLALLARNLPRERQPFIGHLVVMGFLMMIVGMLMSVIG